MSENSFQDVLKKFPSAVSVVTVGQGGVENGLTVSWASPVAFDPPLFMISVYQRHYSVELLDSTKGFVVNVLAKGQEKLAGRFAKQSFTDADKLDDVPHRTGDSGSAILTESLAYFDCKVVAKHEHGDHYLYIGEVTAAETLNEGQPLTATDALRYRPVAP